MDYGIVMFATDYALRPGEVAREVEQRGFESLWFPEHTHIPTSRLSPWPGGAALPKEYSHTHDLFIALSMAAAATTTLKVGSGICLVVERDPIILAKEVATLDFLSRGRFLFGIGGGWNAEEMANHGTDFTQRWKVLRERVEAMKAIWQQDEAEYHGATVSFDPLWSYPKPVQKPHPPVYLGGHGAKALDRVVRYCDGWMPIPMQSRALLDEIADLRRRAAAAGRDPQSLAVTLYGVPADADRLREFAAAGVTRAIFALPPVARDKALPLLDRYQSVVTELRAHP